MMINISNRLIKKSGNIKKAKKKLITEKKIIIESDKSDKSLPNQSSSFKKNC